MLTFLLAAVLTAQAAAPAPQVKAPDTAAGRGLTEFIDTFNAGGDTRRAWLETRTTIPKDNAAQILQMDAQVLSEHGKFTITRIAASTDTSVVAIAKHEKSGVHARIEVQVEPAAPHKIVNMTLRGATPEEIKGGGPAH